jgi:hypothetical protein
VAGAVTGLATKQDVQASEKRLIERIDESQSELARIASAGFASVEELFNELDVKARLKAFERKFQKLEEALHIKL